MGKVTLHGQLSFGGSLLDLLSIVLLEQARIVLQIWNLLQRTESLQEQIERGITKVTFYLLFWREVLNCWVPFLGERSST